MRWTQRRVSSGDKEKEEQIEEVHSELACVLKQNKVVATQVCPADSMVKVRKGEWEPHIG